MPNVSGPGAPEVIRLGNSGASQTVDMGGRVNAWVTVTLTANCTLTISNGLGGDQVKLLVAQDSTGGRTLTLSDGSTSTAVTIDSTAGSQTIVDVFCDGSNLWV